MSDVLLAEGRNYQIVGDGPIVTCRVVARADLTMAEGAACAAEMLKHLSGRAKQQGTKGLVFDVRSGPRIAGPKTQESLSELFRAWAAQEKRVGILVADPMQELQFQRLATDTMKGHFVVGRNELDIRKFIGVAP
jgi:hypothetical protein